MEYAIESSALFNPSIVEDFDQSDLEMEKNHILPCHWEELSSIRRAILDKNKSPRNENWRKYRKPKIRKTLFNKELCVTDWREMRF
jgi:hypothetical protein